ncbi:MAG: amino acid ABC transporter substrate-binding protein [SAR324 cluster bacterium]|nr:amino acid ABC transporter substrate-binding protein [SAR324 cluster bacterium]MBL7035265.1 amino acid ABC transporter substrate-binding protein [SAR324 cluster bacterium]
MRIFNIGIVLLSGIFLACSSIAFAKVTGDTITLGAAVSLTGKYSTNGKHTKNGYELAKNKLNAAGGVKVGGKSYKLDIIYYDDESTPARAAQLAERLIKQDGVKFMLGPYSSGLTKAIAPVTEKYKIPMVEANGASRSLFTKGYRYMFAILTSADQYLASAVDLAAAAAEAKGKSASSLKVAMIFENDPFSQDVRLGVVEAYKNHGMKAVVDDKLPKNIDDMSASLAKVKATRPDILIVSGHSKGAATAIRQISQMRVDVPMLAMTHCDSAGYKEKFGDAAEYTLCAAQWHKSLSYSDSLFGSAADYAVTFKGVYNYDPPYQAAESSAALQVWKDAFERAQSFDTDKLRDALAVTKMQTFYGNISFDSTGKNLGKPMVLFQVLDGKYKVVSPPKWASTKLVHPRPKWSER